ncbi:MAG TPA: site-specific tyrosine recombinase XerD [Streptosporangiaceae bacterium]|nr:site-specific tyrosine recombinase XerD [Streptosporangiaceae bacterium]
MSGTADDALGGVVGRYLDHLVVERGAAAHTSAAYRRDLARYQQEMSAHGKTRAGEVTSADIADFLTRLREGDDGHPPLAASSAARALVAVRGLHAFAAAQGLTPTDPASPVRPPVPPRKLPRAISVADVERLIQATGMGEASDSPAGLRDRALVELLYATGARISEAVGLDVDDLALTTAGTGATERPGTLRLSGKGGKQRVLPVGAYARAALDAYLVRARPTLAAAAKRARTSPAVFLNARGGRLTRQGAWAVLKAAAVRAGLPEVTPHTLRHSFATHLIDGGADVRVVQELLGHASVTTTQVYTLVTVEKLREVYAASHPRAR